MPGPMIHSNLKRKMLMAVFCGLLCACTAASLPPGDPAALHPRNLLVLHVADMTTGHATETGLRSPMSGQMFDAGQVDPAAPRWMTLELVRQLNHAFSPQRVTQAQDHASIPPGTRGFNANLETRAAVQAMGSAQKADYVIIGYVYDFRERSGSDYGIETPAQIAFELNLLEVVSGRLVWQKHYKEKQKSLDEDILQFKTFWRRKGRWITAKEMAASAMQEMISQLTKKYR